jgi:hypothetical protein
VSRWTSDELEQISAADELQLASLRPDGTLRKPVTIWVVRHGDDLFVRSAYGAGSKWFRGVQERYEGHISSGDIDKDVAFVEDNAADDAVDAAYRSKYGGRYAAEMVDPMVRAEVRATTIRLEPRP